MIEVLILLPLNSGIMGPCESLLGSVLVKQIKEESQVEWQLFVGTWLQEKEGLITPSYDTQRFDEITGEK